MLGLFVLPSSTELRHGLQDLYCAYVIIPMTASPHNILDSEKLTNYLIVLLHAKKKKEEEKMIKS